MLEGSLQLQQQDIMNPMQSCLIYGHLTSLWFWSGRVAYADRSI